MLISLRTTDGCHPIIFSRSFPSQACPLSVQMIFQSPDLTGKVFIVTCGNSGIGKDTVKVCTAMIICLRILPGPFCNTMQWFIYATRNQEKSTAIIKELKTVTGKEEKFNQLNLSDL
ncbi:hypothetical protein L208DRAFT_798827 [Tricholoma matsutake]|nr:hypothetical protein L208DRAFT_798827 [Tricholoma matsutake 945]